MIVVFASPRPLHCSFEIICCIIRKQKSGDFQSIVLTIEYSYLKLVFTYDVAALVIAYVLVFYGLLAMQGQIEPGRRGLLFNFFHRTIRVIF